MELAASPSRSPYSKQLAVKHGFDFAAATLVLLLALPVLAIAAVAVWLSLGRPILFRQVRIGQDGRPFEILKLRSMRQSTGDEPAAAPDLSLDLAPGGVEGADRRTRVGTFLRRSSLDELPQLINVLRGEMSLVGPRPERPEFVDLFRERIDGYPERHRVRPGITGWAQVNGLRGRTSLADRVELDNHYIDNWSLSTDLKILALTAPAVVRSL